jgi:hypothetical protein
MPEHKVRIAVFYENRVSIRTLKPAQIIQVKGANSIQLLRDKSEKPVEKRPGEGPPEAGRTIDP